MKLARVKLCIMRNLSYNPNLLNKCILLSAVVFGSLFSPAKTNAAFVPEKEQSVARKAVSAENTWETYSFLAGLSNREIEKLSGKKLSLRERAGLYWFRRQNKVNAADPTTLTADWVDKCFIMHLRNGDVMEVKLIQISTTQIKYQLCNKPDDPENIIGKGDVHSIVDSNGEAIYSSKDEQWNMTYGKDVVTDRLALASGITGIAALTLGLLFWPLGLAAGIAAGVMGLKSMSRFKTNPKIRGRGWGITGIVSGGIWKVLGILIIIVLITGLGL